MTHSFEVGVITFGEISPDLRTGALMSPRDRMAEIVEQGVVADEVGLDVYAVGEHHRSDFVASAPPVILAAVAARTNRIRLTSGVTVLGSEDPVRVFQDFATLDLLSDGRAEIIAGRGSFSESFPLFGYDVADYADLYREKLDALLAIRAGNPAVWRGGPHTRDLTGLDVAPRPVGELPIWVGSGGTPASAVRAGSLGLPLALGLVLGPIGQFTGAVAKYYEAFEAAGHPAANARVGITAHGYVGATSQGARDTMYPYFKVGIRENNHQRGAGFDLPRAAFDAQATPGGGLLVGSPQEVIDKLMTYHELYGVTRAVFHLGYGHMPQRDHLAAIERLGTEVAPVMRREVSRTAGSAA
ncbi:alkanesulfonate monooxygenase SsuD/methylene tetrahydromethanopterin reductase-like flavin-dependent oxidoreductase (luciferase family) [Thermocatellispora tengchongensis]|uniref:Alkanesulfonate monooxygenase SsuD/methylene tetrahydromethanopterin reductase-like flavin-dependent oxidoreductase (Luciferase family) n=2 Tax=Thermocatellispora tengchongensis TaxID=1073253 RepID=A0A840PAP3_9ACTN|nr:alkanesulfonate monooxygenase SsuD/methylene tetrahydromethanopterin reductase-like flavin-dependent oxidoreductase (luciferase family) [Thermocatellispora tengchongensis]